LEGDLVPSLAALFGGTTRVDLPEEFTSEGELLIFLGLSAAELKKIWWFRGRMYSRFDIAKRHGKTRPIAAPDTRLKMLQRNIASSLGQDARCTVTSTDGR
jgi:RNA-directed DNA polymerase